MATKSNRIVTVDEAVEHLKQIGVPLSGFTIRESALAYEAGKPGLKCFRKGGIKKYGKLGFALTDLEAWAQKRGGWIDAKASK
jgi:hypothetical protein